jgi:hypothetical protein
MTTLGDKMAEQTHAALVAQEHYTVWPAEHRMAAEGAAPPPVDPLTGLPPDGPKCRLHGIYKLSVAHYYCEECAKEGRATVGPAAVAQESAPREAVLVLEELQRWTKTVLEEPCGTRWDWLEERITSILAALRTEAEGAPR